MWGNRQAAAKAAEEASAQRGERGPLPLHPVSEADAADLLISALDMLKHNPEMEVRIYVTHKTPGSFTTLQPFFSYGVRLTSNNLEAVGYHVSR